MMRKQNSTFKTAFLSEAGSGLENHDYFAFVELEEYACYVLADGLNDLPDAESARLATQTIILAFQEHPSIKKRVILSYLKKANRTLAEANSREHLKASVTVLVTNYEKARYAYAGNTRLRLYRDGLVKEETTDMSLGTDLVKKDRLPDDVLSRHEQRNNLYTYLGQGRGFKPFVSKKIRLNDGDLFALYSRGIWENPLWNIEWIDFDSADFMVPCIDGIYYEHEFLLNDRAEEDGYMIQANEDILEIRHEKKKIVIKSSQEIFERWKALHIIHLPAVRSLDYDAPMLSNHKKESFIRRYAQKQSVPLMTKADLFRRVMELDIGDFIELQDIEVGEMGEMNIGQEILRENRKIYFAEKEINGFACEELFPMESRRTLLLKFQEKQPGHYLNGSMVRFVVSQMQLEINEYRCVGVIL